MELRVVTARSSDLSDHCGAQGTVGEDTILRSEKELGCDAFPKPQVNLRLPRGHHAQRKCDQEMKPFRRSKGIASTALAWTRETFCLEN